MWGGVTWFGKNYFLYESSQSLDNISLFSFAPSTGSYTAVSGSPYATGGSLTNSAVIDPPCGFYIKMTLHLMFTDSLSIRSLAP